jgi:hypothetical protein
MDFTDDIKRSKPNLSLSSAKTYNSLLRTIYKNVFENEKEPHIKHFSDTEKVLKYVREKPYNVRKTYLAALLCVVPNEKAYKDLMLEDINQYNQVVSESQLTDKLENSAINTEEIEEIATNLKNMATLLMKKKSHTVSELMTIQNYVILSLYYGHIVPRRALDYVSMLFRNYDPKTQNYIDLKRNLFVFNVFKTAKFKGTQTLEIPPSLKKILVKWISLIPDGVDNLLFNSNLLPLSAITLNQRLNSIFGGNKSVNSLRHFYLTSKYKEVMKAQNEMSNDMNEMGSSTAQANVYVKVNDKKKK